MMNNKRMGGNAKVGYYLKISDREAQARVVAVDFKGADFIYLSIDLHLACFHILASMNHAAVTWE